MLHAASVLLFRCLPILITATFSPGPSIAQEAQSVDWFQSAGAKGAASAWYRWALDPSIANADSARITIVTDGHCSLYVNGQRILKNVSMQRSGTNIEAMGFEIKSLLRKGRNTVAVEVHSTQASTRFGISATAITDAAATRIGGGWRIAPIIPPVGWQQTDFNDRDWPEVKPAGDAPGDRIVFSVPEMFSDPVLPAKSRVEPFQFEEGDRIVLVGATFFERAQLSEHLEAALAGACGEKHVTFRNLGWSADTTYADSRGIFDEPDVGYLRMVEHIRAEEPTVAFVCYGQNEALTAGMTPEKYSQQLGRLLDELSASGITCILISPHELFPASPPIPSPSRFNPQIKVFSEATSSVAQSRGLLFVDLFTDFTKRMLEIDYAINACYKAPPEASTGDELAIASNRFTQNGMHLSEHGYACAAVILRERLLRIPAILPTVTVDASEKSVEGESVKVRSLSWNPDAATLVTFEVQEEALSALPLVIQLTDSVDASNVRVVLMDTESSETLLHHSVLRETSGTKIGGTTFAASVNPQYEELRDLLRQKNELYFHRWRPQNITYLFGFRKHEQGNNAADIAKFDPFIQDLEKQIHKLQQPRWRTVTVKKSE